MPQIQTVYYAQNDLQIKHKFTFIRQHKRLLLKRQTGLERFIALIIYYGINPLCVCTRSAGWRETECYPNQIEKYKLRIPNGVLSTLQKAKNMECVTVSESFLLSHKISQKNKNKNNKAYFPHHSMNNLERKKKVLVKIQKGDPWVAQWLS